MTGAELLTLNFPSEQNVPPLLLRYIPSGRFLMGSSHGLPHAPEDPEHNVEVKAFWMADSPVTQGQYSAIAMQNPSFFRGDLDLPVETVRWLEAVEFCDTLGRHNGRSVRLPSEAEWEYACRAGSCTQFHFGDSAAELTHYAWFENNSGGKTARVRRKKPNAWGLFDMNGNVWEWCLDIWHDDYNGAPVDGSAWQVPVSAALEEFAQNGRGVKRTAQGTAEFLHPLAAHSRALCALHQRHCVRGGAWDMDFFRCRSSYRSFDWAEVGTSRTGFRIVVDA